MDIRKTHQLLAGVKSGKIPVADAMLALKGMPYEDIGFAKLDTHRHLRCGFPEVVFCQGKTLRQITVIFEKLSAHTDRVMATKADPAHYRAIRKIMKNAVYHEEARIVTLGKPPKRRSGSPILIVSAGTSDIPVAEEAAVTAEYFGGKTEKVFDAGVAGIHRLFKHKHRLDAAEVIVVVAGMEGALASIVGGLVDVPVIGVPTSVGYGSSFKGLAALLAMLNTCAPGVCVMNIDNGFGAGYFAAMLIRRRSKNSFV
ncbi:MAG: nickel pincer cofactor biosynthesis protein LarB [Candidatus Omnitrophica bacterium]|nr:nickel pincer cofactor biosynthesis protein LarB [Candidatus Omnitrophota bacterium]